MKILSLCKVFILSFNLVYILNIVQGPALYWLHESTDNGKLWSVRICSYSGREKKPAFSNCTLLPDFQDYVVELQEYTRKHGKHGLSKYIFRTGWVQEAGEDRRTRLDSSHGIWARHFHGRRRSSQRLSPLK